MNWHRYGRRKKEFLAQIERIVLWKEWLKLIQPCYYKGERSNKPYPLEIMLRLYLLQNLYDLSDKATVAEAIDSRAFSDFWGLILKTGTIADSTIIAAPSSTKNKEKKRDPEAHQVKKGQHMALRLQSAYRRGQGQRIGAYGGGNGGKCPRCDRSIQAADRR